MKLIELERREAMRDRVLQLEKERNQVAHCVATFPENELLRNTLEVAVTRHVKVAQEFYDRYNENPAMRVEVENVQH